MIAWLLLRLHARKSNHLLKVNLHPDDFALLLAKADGYYNKIPRWCWWF